MGKFADNTVRDLEFIYNWINKTHPGPVEKECCYPVFKNWFERGHRLAENRASKVKTKSGYERVVHYYVEGFKDKHLRLEPKKNETDKNLAKRDIASIDLRNNLCWIRLKSFHPRSKKQLNQLRKVVDDIKHCRKEGIIVFDLRNIEGGHTVWGVEMLNNLFTKKYIDSLKNYPYRKFSLVFRVSQENIENLEKSQKKLKENKSKMYYKKILVEMKKAFKKNKRLVRVYFGKEESKTERVPNPVKGRVYVLTKGGRSAALLVLDRLLSIPSVVQVGCPTGSDTLYGECGEVNLPSGNFRLIYPTAIRDYIIRENNERYFPEHVYRGDISNIDKVEDWILRLDKKLNQKN